VELSRRGVQAKGTFCSGSLPRVYGHVELIDEAVQRELKGDFA